MWSRGEYRCGGTGISATLLLECGYRGTFIPPELPTSGAFVFKDRPCVGLLPYLGSGLVTDVRISDLDGFGPSHPVGARVTS